MTDQIKKIAAEISQLIPSESEFIEAHQKPAPVSIRLHPRKAGNTLFDKAETVPWCTLGRYLGERPSFTFDPAFHAGAYYVQEASSMCIDAILKELFANKEKLRILDLCGAPGGKSTLLASFLDGNGLLVCNEVIRSRAQVLKENMDKWGYANVLVSNNDPRDLKRLKGFFDVIVCDAPCSGSGMFRKDPETAAHWSLDAVEHCASRQSRIIDDCWPALKPGGILIYSTCSYSIQENEAQTERLARKEEAEILFTESLKDISGIVQTNGGFRFYPHLIRGEGFFVSVLLKNAASQDEFTGHAKTSFQKVSSEIARLLNKPEEFVIWQGKTAQHLFPAEQAEDMAQIAPLLYLLKAGIEMGETKGSKYIPSHELALFTELAGSVPRLELNREQAISYLRKEALPNPSRDSGIQLITCEGRALGWGNALPNRINNLLPKSWRIRKEEA